MEDQGIFKTSMFGGFDKQSVLTYVDELMSKSQEHENALQERIDDLTAERDRLSSQEAELQSRIASLEEHLSKAAETQRELNIKNARIEELEAKLIHAASHTAQLESALAENERNHHKYDEIAAQVGAVMVEAQKNADSIVARAQDQANRVAQESVERVYEMNSRIDQVKEDIRRLRSYAMDTLEDVERRMQGLETAIDDTENHLFISAGLMPESDDYNPVPVGYQETPRRLEPEPVAAQPEHAAGVPSHHADLRDHGDDFFAGPCQS